MISFKAGDGDKYYRDTQLTETVTSRHTASQYRPVDFRLPVGGGQFGDISGRCARSRSSSLSPVRASFDVDEERMNVNELVLISGHKKELYAFSRSLLSVPPHLDKNE